MSQTGSHFKMTTICNFPCRAGAIQTTSGIPYRKNTHRTHSYTFPTPTYLKPMRLDYSKKGALLVIVYWGSLAFKGIMRTLPGFGLPIRNTWCKGRVAYEWISAIRSCYFLHCKIWLLALKYLLKNFDSRPVSCSVPCSAGQVAGQEKLFYSWLQAGGRK